MAAMHVNRAVLLCTCILFHLEHYMATLIDTMKHDIFIVTPKNFDSQISSYRNHGVAAVVYYNPTDKTSKDFVTGLYNEVAKELRGMAKMAGIDCSQWMTFCTDQKISDTPAVVIYPAHPLPSIIYKGKMEHRPLVGSITGVIQGDNIITFKPDETKKGLDTFLSTNIDIPRVILFSEKASPPILYKAISNSFHDRLSFSYVNSKTEEVLQRFKIKKFPSILLITGAVTPQTAGVHYTGEMNFQALYEWLNVHAETFVKGGGYSSDNAVAEEKPWMAHEVPEITGPSHQDVCFRHKALCVIYASKSGEPSQGDMDLLAKLQKEFKAKESERTVHFIFSWFDVSIETGLAQTTGLTSDSPLPTIFIFNPHKRLRYVKLADTDKPTEENIRILMEKIIGGDARFTNVKGQKLQPFAVRKAAPAAPKREDL